MVHFGVVLNVDTMFACDDCPVLQHAVQLAYRNGLYSR